MNKELIERLLVDSGLDDRLHTDAHGELAYHFAALVAEECAKLAEAGISNDTLAEREPFVAGEDSGYRRAAGYIREAFKP